MKKSILAISLLSSLTILYTGCGSSDSKKVDLKDVVVKFKTSANYDLSQYITSNKNQINNYVIKTYKNEEGKKKYNDIPDETSYDATRIDVNGTIIKEYDGSELDTTYSILTNKLVSTEADDNSTITVARYADKGDYVSKIDKTIQSNGLSLTYIHVCKVADYLASKEINGNTYTDVLKITCEGSAKTPAGAKLNNVPYSVLMEITSTGFYAKNQGNIWEEEETCNSTTVNKTTSESCEKEITEITTISN
jgi:hypothetical protein